MVSVVEAIGGNGKIWLNCDDDVLDEDDVDVEDEDDDNDDDVEVEDRRRRERENAAGLREAWTGSGRPPIDSQVMAMMVATMMMVVMIVMVVILLW